MKNTENSLYFSDPEFPIKIRPYCTSTVNDESAVTTATHEAIEIKYFYEGESTLLIGDKTIFASAGDVIVINPYEFHSTVDYGKKEKGRYHLIMVGLDFFNGESALNVNLRHIIFGRQTFFKTQFKDAERLREILIRAIDEYEKGDFAARLSLFGLMAEFFAILLRSGTVQSNTGATEDIVHYYKLIEPALRIIRDGYSSQFTVDSLAAACRVSKYHFCRIFKTVMGASPIQYLNAYRLKIADTLLTSSDYQISDVAASCGFIDVSYFCRIYKKHFGYSPKQSKRA